MLRILRAACVCPLALRYAPTGNIMTRFVVFSLMLFSCTVYADSVDLDKKMQECRELSSYPHLAACFSNVYKDADILLNEEYKNLFEYLNNENRNNLVVAQKNWIQFRDTDCFFSDPRPLADNSIAQANHNACLANQTIQRVKQLESYNVPWNKGCNGCPW